MKKVLLIAAAAASVSLLAGCNTARGLGADIERLGQIIQGKAQPPAQTEVVETTEVVEQGSERYVQPGEPAAYPYQAGQQPAVYPYSSQPVPADTDSSTKPKLGDVPAPVNVKEM